MNLKIKIIVLFIVLFPIIVFAEKDNNTLTPACNKCHQHFETTQISKKVVHPPMQESDCEACHDPHGKSNQLILKGTIQDICFVCHDNNRDDFQIAHSKIFVPKNSCIKCHNPHASDNKKLLPLNEHAPFKQRKCTMCHIESEDSTKLVMPISKLCRKCHMEKNTASVYHVPFLVGDCLACHDQHVSNNKFQLKISTGYMCINECHNAIRKENNDHLPVKNRECLSCHSPHQSPNKFLLKLQNNKKMDSISDLCINCHKNILDKKNIHLVVLAGDCDSCHQNHDSREKKLLKFKGKELCYQACHTDIEKNTFVHKPIREGDCISCHNPHRSANKKLLSIKDDILIINIAQLCYQCHLRFDPKPGIHKPVAQGQCDLCHEVHSSKNANLLKEKGRQLCLKCHPEKGKAENHTISENKQCIECHEAHYPRQG